MHDDFPDPPTGSADAMRALELEQKVTGAYADTAKTFATLTTGALGLSITFVKEIIGSTAAVQAVSSRWLVAAWCFWLLAAVASAGYQYLAARFVEGRGAAWGVIRRRGHPQPFGYLGRHPWPVYGVMLVCFALGTGCFVVFGVTRLPGG